MRLNDYLAISEAEARKQFIALGGRNMPVPGQRQVVFSPVETLLCLAASLVVNHRRYGGSTAHKAVEPVPTLARLFSRPPSSILAKMANLDGSRTNGAKYEVEVSERLMSEPGALAEMYVKLVRAARQVGIRNDQLPDFLHLESPTAKLVLEGQDELVGIDLPQAVSLEQRQWREKRSDLEDAITERLLVAAARIGQHRFAVEVLTNHSHRCAFCGLHVSTGGKPANRMLIASHIKPWKDSTASERLDVQNGIAACPTHDVAFDTGLMTVTRNMDIRLRADIDGLIRMDPALRAVFGRPPLADKLLLDAGASRPKEGYLDWHHGRVFGQLVTD